jgi:uncharacterized protein with FMN-binding domain
MRRAVSTFAGISTLVVLLLSLKPHQMPHQSALPAGSAGGAAPPAKSGAGSAPGGHGAPGGHSATGTFTGQPFDNPYGTVQVAVTLVKGKITAVHVLQKPHNADQSRQIAASSLPQLTKEALHAQSARIDAVSGASYDSRGYAQSLQSALDHAHA